MFGHRVLAIVCEGFYKKDIKIARCIRLLWRYFCISRIKIDEAIVSTTCVEAKKEALARSSSPASDAAWCLFD